MNYIIEIDYKQTMQADSNIPLQSAMYWTIDNILYRWTENLMKENDKEIHKVIFLILYIL